MRCKKPEGSAEHPRKQEEAVESPLSCNFFTFVVNPQRESVPRELRTQGRARLSHLPIRSGAVGAGPGRAGRGGAGGAGQPRRGVGRGSGAEGRERAGLGAEEPHPLLLPADLPMEAAGEPLFPREEVLGGGARSAQVRTVPRRDEPGAAGLRGIPRCGLGLAALCSRTTHRLEPFSKGTLPVCRVGTLPLCLPPGAQQCFLLRSFVAPRCSPGFRRGSRRWAPDFVVARSLVNKYSGVQRKGMAPYQRFTGRLDASPSVFLAQYPFLLLWRPKVGESEFK